jgi:transketolase
MISESTLSFLAERARIIRAHVIRMVYAAQSGHIGPSLSIADLLSALYFQIMRIDPRNPGWPERDRFILSKGHGCSAWYAALAERGYFPVEELLTFRRLGSRLQGHPDMAKTPGVDMTSGSLGHGLAAGLGMALAARLDGLDYRTYVILGDGEIQEGLVWEAALAAPRLGLDNLVAILDCNRWQSGGAVEEILPLEPLAEKWRAFGWSTQEIDGHDLKAILEALERARAVEGRPSVLIARTIKGRGVSFMENDNKWHMTPPTREEAVAALEELGEKGVDLP